MPDVEVRARTRDLEERNAEILKQSGQVRELSWRLLRAQDEERRHIARELQRQCRTNVNGSGHERRAARPKKGPHGPRTCGRGGNDSGDGSATASGCPDHLLPAASAVAGREWFVLRPELVHAGFVGAQRIADQSGYVAGIREIAARHGIGRVSTRSGMFDQHSSPFWQQNCIDSNRARREPDRRGYR